jgi:formylglycine-generating enzyme required for sulfatase activity
MPANWIKVVIAVLIVALIDTAAAAPPESTLNAGQTFRDCPECPEMVVVPAGNFLMGSSTVEAEREIAVVTLPFVAGAVKGFLAEERPQHAVHIRRSFALGKYPVTRGEFASFIYETGYSSATDCTFYLNHRFSRHPGGNWQTPGFPQTDNTPVVCVSWYDAVAYVQWLNRKLGDGATGTDLAPYHLPIEAEWEYAARAGSQTARWWGDDLGRNNALCHICGNPWDPQGTVPVDSFRANPFGLFGMLGNASQWTEDCWNPNYDDAPSDGSGWTTGDCGLHVTRSGGWESDPWVVRSAGRTREDVDRGTNFIGFRVAKILPEVDARN